MPYEVSNALHKRITAGEITSEDAVRLMETLESWRIAFYDASSFHFDAFQLAARFGQRTIYDSHYLVLAQALECEFWTADERFYRSVTDSIPNIRLVSEETTLNP